MDKEWRNWLENCLLPTFKDFKELADKVTSKKAYQEYLDELRQKIDTQIESIEKKLNHTEVKQ
jgi:hypothetical protein